MTIFARSLANFLMATLLLFLIHRYFIFWHDWPNVSEALSVFSDDEASINKIKAITVLSTFFIVFAFIIWHATANKTTSLMKEADRYKAWAAYVIRFAFWSVFLIGLFDATLSALRIENVLITLVGEPMDTKLGLSKFRGLYFHYPLLILSAIIAAFTRGLSFIWLAFLVVLAEFSIVITRFIFSYEQAYMGDLVRFWYAALFLFASSYTLIEEGHVRVDVIYASMRAKSKAWVNTIGCLLLGIPFCFTILLMGLEGRHSSLSSPIINFEISQSAYGMFVKYLMAGFLIIFAVSMAIQFISYFLSNAAVLLNDDRAPQLTEEA